MFDTSKLEDHINLPKQQGINLCSNDVKNRNPNANQTKDIKFHTYSTPKNTPINKPKFDTPQTGSIKLPPPLPPKIFDFIKSERHLDVNENVSCKSGNIVKIMNLGFTEEQAVNSLSQNGDDFELALNALLE